MFDPISEQEGKVYVMSKFHVNPSGIKNSGATLADLGGELEQCVDSVRHIRNSLNGAQWVIICMALQREKSGCSRKAELYENAETR